MQDCHCHHRETCSNFTWNAWITKQRWDLIWKPVLQQIFNYALCSRLFKCQWLYFSSKFPFLISKYVSPLGKKIALLVLILFCLTCVNCSCCYSTEWYFHTCLQRGSAHIKVISIPLALSFLYFGASGFFNCWYSKSRMLLAIYADHFWILFPRLWLQLFDWWWKKLYQFLIFSVLTGMDRICPWCLQ